ncbi:hypothetical protein [Rhodobacter maris]|uniref:Uncharacterized protein n=1 Tax=Rhodobacter maris TaxID=446682 RepID=A0A285SB14_9RHOB|nr:hypothetical protein [Rhodobacter maris]SOC04824.1 hypothetical protein SAMN05877831_10435 [Rhodobacter maris]
MSATETSSVKGTLVMYLVALIIIGGAVAGFLMGGIGMMTLWFVGLTFFMLALMVVMSIA